MNAVEIEEAISALAEQPFDGSEFPFAFLQAFGNKETTIKKLRAGASNSSDLGGVLCNHIHIAVCASGAVTKTLAALKASPATAKAKARFILATDGADFEAEDFDTGETVACAYADFPDHFGFFLPLAGITTVKQVRESSFDIRATSRMNRLYVELLKDNPDWGTAARRHDMNHFMARLIFCFFAERTDIFNGIGLFTDTIARMSAKDSSDTHKVIGQMFRSMNTKREDRASAGIPRWADAFPYVNGELFSGSVDTPRFSKIARAYLQHIGSLDWTKINPDIFGSMIQAVAEDEERGALGMHYTSVPNILKVLNPLFLDDLRTRLAEADDNPRKLLNLRNRMAKIRVFDPACGSGNFLVIAYKAMREIEAEINKRRGEADRRSEIPPTNFRGIELRDFPAEVARLALIIAEFQCDVLYRGQKEALQDFLPLDAQNWITCGNALRLDWLSICRPAGTTVKFHGDDLFGTPLDQAQIDFENEGGEAYLCGNPPYLGGKKQDESQKADMIAVFGKDFPYKNLDYICAFLEKASLCLAEADAAAFVCTSSVNQGSHVPTLWPRITERGVSIHFAYRPFKWANNAKNNAGVFVTILGLAHSRKGSPAIYDVDLRTSGSYADDILSVLDPNEKTIIHIPSVNSRESTKDKIREVEHIIEALGEWQGVDPATGFQLVKRPDGRLLRIADLVDDDPAKRDKVSAALKDPAQKNNRDHVDIIIALGMAKEGFDWIWCEHALTVGYRSSLTEIVQIIGRATRDAPGKTRARFTNLIAEPDASEEAVTEAVNDTLKAIAASLLMEQVLAPRFNFTPKNPQSGPVDGFDYGEGGYDTNRSNVGFNEQTGQFHIEIKGLAEPKSKEAARICTEDLNEVIAAFVQDKPTIERGLFDEELIPEDLTQVRMGKIIKDKYPELDEEDQEVVRQHAIAALNITQQAKQIALGGDGAGGDDQPRANTALIDGVRQFAMDVRELDIDLIDRINPFGEAYAILAKSINPENLAQIRAAIAAKRTGLTPDEAKELAVRASRFKKERGRLPSIDAQDPWERRMAEGAVAFMRFKKEGRYDR